jgi:hypothetical protein
MNQAITDSRRMMLLKYWSLTSVIITCHTRTILFHTIFPSYTHLWPFVLALGTRYHTYARVGVKLV